MESSKIKGIKPFYVMDVLERAHAMEREGKNVIHLEVGEPDFDTPEPVKRAMERALADNKTHYTHSLGLVELREAICAHYAARYGVAVHPDQVLVANGTSPAMFMLFAALLEPGDEVVISDPGYACYANFVRFAGGEPALVRVFEEDGFQYRPEAIRARMNDRTRAILINSPANPTGTLLSEDRMRAVAGLGVPVVSDEIYHGLVYGEGAAAEHSILEFTDNAFVFNGFSKLYAMTGLRLGYLIAPRPYMRGFQKLAQNFFISPNSVVQWAGIAALTECADDVARMTAIYDERRRFMIKRLKEIGLGIQVEPTGAFYVLANARHLCIATGKSSYDIAFDILESAHVGVTPGTDFGPGGDGYIRFSYANSLANIAEGMDRLERYVARVC
ncbi:MAG: pyridoxal phosphate-dependent aminotransferase [Desulfovibrionaceae bacterium]